MKKNVMLKINKIILIAVFLFSSCQKKLDAYYFDFLGDDKLDTLIIKDNGKPYIQDIFLLKNNQQKKIISILPLKDSTYVMTQPKIENIYIEANDVQSQEKGIRIIVRNTDIIPDCFFIDLYYKNQWYVEYYGIINTNSSDSLYIKKEKINRSVFNEFGHERICNSKEIIRKYFY